MSQDLTPKIQDLISLKGRTALITGGAGYIGKAIANAYAELGANIAILDMDEDTIKETTASISEQYSVKTMSIPLDLTDDEALRKVPDGVVQELGGLDILVNSAAFTGDSGLSNWAVPFKKQSVSTWRAALDVNLTASFSLCQSSADHLTKSGKGSIINIASIYGVVGPDNALYEGTEMGNPSAYGASKGGLIQFTRYLSTELAPKVRANSISPGGLWRNQDPTFVVRYEKRTPMQRMGTEQDLIGSAIFLASDMSGYVTGQNILVDGGWTAW
jgi:NAD(P)-dependent dehydrogenase (short-subunit alcohol dehydrogenase family)